MILEQKRLNHFGLHLITIKNLKFPTSQIFYSVINYRYQNFPKILFWIAKWIIVTSMGNFFAATKCSDIIMQWEPEKNGNHVVFFLLKGVTGNIW